MSRLSGRIRWWLAIGLLVIVVSMLWGGLVRPLMVAMDTTVEQLHDSRFELARARAVLNQRNKVSEAMVAQEEGQVLQRLLAGDAAASASATLQGNIDRIARESGLQLESMSAEPITSRKELTELIVVLRARGPETALLAMLTAMESQPTLMVIDRLTVVAQDQIQAPASKAVTNLVIEMRIGGYWARPNAPGKAARS